MRTVTGPTHRVVVVGAGLGGLACALHLAGAGRHVTVLERASEPGGRAGRLRLDGFSFDTGPTVLTMPSLIAETLAAVGEELPDWLDLVRLDPSYRARFADGSTLDVIGDTARMAASVSRLCGPREADGYLRFAEWARRLWELQERDFIARNLDSPLSLVRLGLLRLALVGGFGSLSRAVGRFFTDERLRRVFSFQALYAGVAPDSARALYAVIAYLDCVLGVWYPRGGMHALPRALAAAGAKHGVAIRYDASVERVEVRGDRAVAVYTSDGARIPADVVVLNPDLPAAWSLLGSPPPRRRLQWSPSCVVLHIGSRASFPGAAHHNVHFGRSWRETFDEVIRRGRLMADPSLLLTNPSGTDSAVAPAGRHVYYVLVPAPNLAVGGSLDWAGGLGERYADALVSHLEGRGYPGFGAAIEVSRVVTPADWAASGFAAGTPFSLAHTMAQTGPFRPGNLHPRLSNVVFVGSGTQPGVGVPMVLISGQLAAQRVLGA